MESILQGGFCLPVGTRTSLPSSGTTQEFDAETRHSFQKNLTIHGQLSEALGAHAHVNEIIGSSLGERIHLRSLDWFPADSMWPAYMCAHSHVQSDQCQCCVWNCQIFQERWTLQR